MARILLAWEFGTNLGHLKQLIMVATRLRARGHQAIFAVTDVTRVESALGAAGFGYLQAPVWRPRLPRPSVIPCSYSEILHHYGYLDREGLLGMVKAWREIYRLVQPDVLLFEHAPTALLASRGFEARRVIYGVGFCSPPRAQPFPNFRPWDEVSQHRLEASDQRVLETVNAVLNRLNLRPVRALYELFDVDDDFLCTFPELDHYGSRPKARYCGSIFTRNEGARPLWPEHGSKRVYVYVRPEMRAFHPLAQELSGSGHRILWVAPGLDEDNERRYRSPRVRFVRDPIRLSEVAAQADAAVLYGGHGTVSAMLLAGIPLALYPSHVEQALVTHRVAQLGAGTMAPSQATTCELRNALGGVLAEPQYKDRATAFAAKYGDFDPAHAVSRIATRIGALCEKSSA